MSSNTCMHSPEAVAQQSSLHKFHPTNAQFAMSSSFRRALLPCLSFPLATTGATATRVTDPLLPALRAPPTSQQEGPTSSTAAAAARAERAAEDSEAWKAGGFPAYLQNEVDDFCAAWDDALQVRIFAQLIFKCQTTSPILAILHQKPSHELLGRHR